jgi:hypothetical protein
VSDYKGATLTVDVLPSVKELLANRGYDADWFRKASLECGIVPSLSVQEWLMEGDSL